MRTLLFGAVLLLGALACPQPQPLSTPEPLHVVSVDNQNWNDAVVYAVPCGASTCRSRVGDVTALSKHAFRLRADQLTSTGEVRLLVHLRAAGDYTLPVVQWMRDARVVVFIAPRAEQSAVSLEPL